MIACLSHSSSHFLDGNGVAYEKPRFSRNQVRKAGDIMIGKIDGDAIDADVVISNWRSAHSCPLQVVRTTLEKKANKIDPNAIVVQRLKRWTSIVDKLKRFPNMKLSTMQDIGGCRAIVKDMHSLVDLMQLYAEHRPASFRFVEAYDYMAKAKPDGYRSIHVVWDYQPKNVDRQAFRGLKIEIQLRTKLQHAWATAVEVVSTFTNQNLKSGIGDDRWKRFFFLASEFLYDLDILRGMNAITTTDGTGRDMQEMVALWDELDVSHKLTGFTKSVKVSTIDMPGAKQVLLRLDAEKKKVNVTGYTARELHLATEQYALMEKESRGNPNVQVVMIGVDSVANLKKAYPNYYLDTHEFWSQMSYHIEVWKKKAALRRKNRRRRKSSIGS